MMLADDFVPGPLIDRVIDGRAYVVGSWPRHVLIRPELFGAANPYIGSMCAVTVTLRYDNGEAEYDVLPYQYAERGGPIRLVLRWATYNPPPEPSDKGGQA